MASTYSTNLKIELIGTGEQSGTWGTTTNTNLGSLIEEAIAGYVTQTVTDGAATVLTIPDGASSNGRNYVIQLTGTLTAARTVEVPAVDKPYIFFNATTGGFAVTVKVSGQTGVTIANGKKAIVYTNSTDVIEVVNAPVSEAGTQTLTNKTLSAPTVTGVATFAAGTVSAPAITTTGDTNTGIFFPAADTIAFAEGGVEAMRIDSSGNVGIGNTSPVAKLDVSGTSRIRTDVSTSTVINTITNAAANAYATHRTDANDYQFYTTGSSKMVIDSSGNVGIGTSSPGTRLSLDGSAPKISLYNNGNYNGEIGLGVLTGFGDSVGINARQATGLVAFGTNNTERMRIDSSGNVGIGTSSPGYALQITRSAAASYVANTDGTGTLLTGVNGSGLGISGTFSNTAFALFSNSSERMRIDSSGNVGIGTSSPISYAGTYDKVLTVFNTDQNLTIGARYQAGVGQLGFINSGTANNSNPIPLAFMTGGVERMRVDETGNVGIGTTSPTQKFHVAGSGSTYTRVSSANAATGAGAYYTNATSTWLIGAGPASGGSEFAFMDQTSGSLERMRIDASGNLLVNGTSLFGSGTSTGGKFQVFAASTTSTAGMIVQNTGNGLGFTNNSGTASYNALIFANNGATSSYCGGVSVSGTTTSFNTSSDYRMKENVSPVTSGLSTISALKPVNYTWISTQEEGEGFLAHELQEVIPLAVNGEKDAVDDNGNPRFQSVDYSKIVVHLVAAIQELKAQNDELKARVAALENA